VPARPLSAPAADGWRADAPAQPAGIPGRPERARERIAGTIKPSPNFISKHLRSLNPMKFTIEILRVTEEVEQVLYRLGLRTISPRWAKNKAQILLSSWKARGANGVRILNGSGQELYRWTE
jgi:hypothetical protein